MLDTHKCQSKVEYLVLLFHCPVANGCAAGYFLFTIYYFQFTILTSVAGIR